MHIELRARTICELVCHQDYYLQPEVIALLDASGLMNSNALPAMSASYDQALSVSENSDKGVALSCFMIDCIKTTKIGTYSNMWHIYALSSVLGIAIRSAYPEQNLRIRPLLNKVIQPRMDNSNNRCITIMWTRTSPPPPWIIGWSPNHFVLCIPKEPQDSMPKLSLHKQMLAPTKNLRQKSLIYSITKGSLPCSSASTKEQFSHSPIGPLLSPGANVSKIGVFPHPPASSVSIKGQLPHSPAATDTTKGPSPSPHPKTGISSHSLQLAASVSTNVQSSVADVISSEHGFQSMTAVESSKYSHLHSPTDPSEQPSLLSATPPTSSTSTKQTSTTSVKTSDIFLMLHGLVETKKSKKKKMKAKDSHPPVVSVSTKGPPSSLAASVSTKRQLSHSLAATDSAKGSPLSLGATVSKEIVFPAATDSTKGSPPTVGATVSKPGCFSHSLAASDSTEGSPLSLGATVSKERVFLAATDSAKGSPLSLVANVSKAGVFSATTDSTKGSPLSLGTTVSKAGVFLAATDSTKGSPLSQGVGLKINYRCL